MVINKLIFNYIYSKDPTLKEMGAESKTIINLLIKIHIIMEFQNYYCPNKTNVSNQNIY